MNSFYSNYRGRYSQYWVKRFGLIPQLPTHYDNANSIYELVAWLQRGFKQLMDDFANLEMEFSDFQDAIKELLENLIPELIRNFAHSKEFRDLMKEIIKDVMNDPDMKDWFTKYLEEIMKRPDFREFFKDYFKELMKDPAMKEWFKNYLKENLKELANDPEFQKILDELLKNNQYLKDLIKGLQDELDRLKGMITQAVQPVFSTLKGGLSSKIEVTDSANATWGLSYSIQDYKSGNKTKRVINIRPAGSYLKLKEGQSLSNNEPIYTFTRKQLEDIGIPQELIQGMYDRHILFRDGGITDNGIRYSLELKTSDQQNYEFVIGGLSYPANWPLQGPHVLSGLDSFKTFIYDIEG